MQTKIVQRKFNKRNSCCHLKNFTLRNKSFFVESLRSMDVLRCTQYTGDKEKWGKFEIETQRAKVGRGNGNHVQAHTICVNLSLKDRMGWEKEEKGCCVKARYQSGQRCGSPYPQGPSLPLSLSEIPPSEGWPRGENTHGVNAFNDK